MCPVCLTNAMLIAGSVTSSGGLAAMAISKLGANAGKYNIHAPATSQPTNGAGEIAAEAEERRDHDVDHHA